MNELIDKVSACVKSMIDIGATAGLFECQQPGSLHGFQIDFTVQEVEAMLEAMELAKAAKAAEQTRPPIELRDYQKAFLDRVREDMPKDLDTKAIGSEFRKILPQFKETTGSAIADPEVTALNQ